MVFIVKRWRYESRAKLMLSGILIHKLSTLRKTNLAQDLTAHDATPGRKTKDYHNTTPWRVDMCVCRVDMRFTAQCACIASTPHLT